MSGKLILAVPSKGRLMEKALQVFADAGLTIVKTGHERGYRGRILELVGVEVAFLSASEIAANLSQGDVHLGITGEDLLDEQIEDMASRIRIVRKLGFGGAD
ncbi:MAG: ATP phosphoribosyltransferase catalytic subunit HisG, partial [Hyphomicrobiales bacterium]